MKRPPPKTTLTKRKSYRDEAGIKKFGDRMREVRKSLGITQEELVRRTGFDLRQIGRIERGEVSTNLSHVFKIAECLGVSVQELFLFSIVETKKRK
jgi:transcriptional regulator with XRE-family HTH domain